MAYLVSQMRKVSGTGTYMKQVSVAADKIVSPNTFGGGNTFTDFALTGTFSPEKVYYLRFQIHKIPKYFYSGSKTKAQMESYQDADELILQILLKNGSGQTDEVNDPPEIIGTCSVPNALPDESDKYSSYSFVFSPSKTFDHIGFRINRVSFDAINSSTPRNWLYLPPGTSADQTVYSYKSITATQKEPITTTGPRIKYSGDDGDVCTLENLITQQNGPSGWLKFGYQSRPGSLIVVNNEPIRVGRSGIYEINNGTIINKFMIASPGGYQNSKIDAFLLDYAYKT